MAPVLEVGGWALAPVTLGGSAAAGQVVAGVGVGGVIVGGATVGVGLADAGVVLRELFAKGTSDSQADAVESTVGGSGGASKGVPPRGLPPEGVRPPVPGEVTPRPASRPSEQKVGGQSLWDEAGGEWRWFPGDKWHNPHWDYNPHTTPNAPWANIPHGDLPPVKP